MNDMKPNDSNAPQSQNGPGFSYTYSAQQRREVERIRAKYIPPKENKMDQLRRLDKRVERKGVIPAICAGVVSTLVFGLGLSMVILDSDHFALGVVIGIVGLAGAAASYPLYRYIIKMERKKLAPEILRLSEELINGQK